MNARVVTTGSVWLFTDDRYCRFPRQEGPRVDANGLAHPEWGNRAGPAQDAVWHRYHRSLFVKDSNDDVLMVIEYDDHECVQEQCARHHYIITGPVLEPIVDPDTVEMSLLEFRLDYAKRRQESADG